MKHYQALHKLRPNTEWVWSGDDLKDLSFITPDVTKPTKAQLDKAITDLEAAEAQRETDKLSALTKLANLGLTEDEAKAVIGA